MPASRIGYRIEEAQIAAARAHPAIAANRNTVLLSTANGLNLGAAIGLTFLFRFVVKEYAISRIA
jgi:hypothetical protein